MHEAIKLFGEICSSTWFSDTNMLLWFTKKDILEDLIKRVDPSEAFPEYTGGNNMEKGKPNNYMSFLAFWHLVAIEFITQKFLAVNKNPERQIFVSYLNTTDSESVKKEWGTGMEKIIETLPD